MAINPTTVRRNGQSLRGYIAVLTGQLVLEATVDDDADLLSAKSLTITISTGSIADVQRGYRVAFYAADGTTFKGQTHVRWNSTLDATHLPVREFSQSEFLILSGDVVRVYSIMSFEDKLVESTETFDPDGVVVGTYNSLPRPLACSGGYDAGFVDGYETATPLSYRTVTTDGSNSMNLDPSSNPAHIAHLWTLPTGVAFAPGSAATDVSPTLRVNVGQYTVYHDVRDTDNNTTWRQCVTYAVYNAANPPVSVIMESAPSGAWDQGWLCSFRAVSPFLTLEDAPDGSPVIFFVRQRIDNTWQSLGGATGRSAVKLMGYLNTDESELTPQLQYQRFEVVSPLTRLMSLPGFSKILIQSADADTWAKVLALTTLHAMIQLARIYTFALDGGHDWLTSPLYEDLGYPELWLQKESPAAQINEIADGGDAYLTCGRSGLFMLNPVLSLLPPADRASLTVAYTFERKDVLRMTLRRRHFDTVETLELHATAAPGVVVPRFVVADAQAVFSRAPGSPGHGADYITVERIIVNPFTAQDDANERAGRRYAWRNGVDTSSSDGEKDRLIEIDVELREVYDFLDFDGTIVHFTGFTNPRRLDLSRFDWGLTRVQLDYASGKVIHSFALLTDSPPGESYYPPGDPLPPVIVPPPPIDIVTTPQDGLLAGVGNLGFIDDNGDLYLGNIQTTPVTWTKISAATIGFSGTPADFVIDPFNPTDLCVVTTTHAYVLTDAPLSSRALTHSYALPTPNLGRVWVNIQTSRSQPGVIGIITHIDDSFGVSDTSVNTGSSYTHFTPIGVAWGGGTGDSAPGGIYVSEHVAGRIWVCALVAAFQSALFRSDDYGASWARWGSNTFPAVVDEVHIPFANSAESVIYVGQVGFNSGSEGLWRITNGGAKQDISPIVGGNHYGVSSNFGFKTCDVQPSTGLLVGYNADTDFTGVFLTRNADAAVPTWTTIMTPALTPSLTGGNIAGNDPNTLFAWGDGVLYVSYNAGASWIDLSGNLSVLGCGIILNLFGYS